MNLKDRLNEIRHAFETGDTPREVIEVLNAGIEKLVAANVADKALQVGQSAPLDKAVATGQGRKSLRAFLDQPFLVITWFRGNW